MAINEWWSDDPNERYWMEITRRDDLGTDLSAPKADLQGKGYWGWEMVNHVPPGDVVLHWHQTLMGEPALVGQSLAVGVAEDAPSWIVASRWVSAREGSGRGPRLAHAAHRLRAAPGARRLTELATVEQELRHVNTVHLTYV